VAGYILESTIGDPPIPQLVDFARKSFTMPTRISVDQAADQLNFLRGDVTTLNDYIFLRGLNKSIQRLGIQ